jgi:hypothetical protein
MTAKNLVNTCFSGFVQGQPEFLSGQRLKVCEKLLTAQHGRNRSYDGRREWYGKPHCLLNIKASVFKGGRWLGISAQAQSAPSLKAGGDNLVDSFPGKGSILRSS